jgi:hypothetical protein
VVALFCCGLSVGLYGVALLLIVLGIGVVSFNWGLCLGGSDKWNVLLSVATLLAVVVALFLDDIRSLLHSPRVNVHIGHDLVDIWKDFDAPPGAPLDTRWIRGRITNNGNRGVESYRLKLLTIEGPNLPQDAGRIQNGFLQWQGGIRDSMRLNPGESWIFDIGTRRIDLHNPALRLCAHFVREGTLISCNLQSPATYTLTLAIYGDNIQSTGHRFQVRIGEVAGDIEFPP